jgi:shikimate kinase
VGGGARHVALIGLMGTGKTTVGRLLAATLGWPLRDSDEQIEAREGVSARVLQERRGAGALHALEASALLEALARAQPSVVCAAAGAIEDQRCRDALVAPGVVAVWLQARLDTLCARYDSDPHRPRYSHGTRAALAAQQAERAGLYASVAAVIVDVEGLGAPEVVATVRAALSAPAAPTAPARASGRC